MNLPVIQPQDNEAGGSSSRGSHRLADVSKCPRKWFYRWVAGVSHKGRDPNGYFRIGSLIHLYLAYHYASKLPVPPRWRTEVPLEEALQRVGEGYPDDMEMARSLYHSYASSIDDGGVQPVAVEHEFRATIADILRLPFIGLAHLAEPMDEKRYVASRIDLLAVINGALWDLDYKSQGRGTKDGYLFRWNPDGQYALDWQCETQFLVLSANNFQEKHGIPFGGVLIQRILKRIPTHCDRNVVSFNTAALRDAALALKQQCVLEERLSEEIVRRVQSGECRILVGFDPMQHWLPPAHPWNCFDGGSACEYRPLCTSTSREQYAAVVEHELEPAK